MEQKVFIIITGIILFLSIQYLIVSRKLNFKLKHLKGTLNKKKVNEELVYLISLSFEKVNGWNTMTAVYTLLHYVLNLCSILFSCISIYFAYNDVGDFSLFASILALLSVTLNLFLRCERKWATFRSALAKGRIETNNFISSVQHASDINDLVKQYAQRIIQIESDLKDSDIT